jgi:hypothetical protein
VSLFRLSGAWPWGETVPKEAESPADQRREGGLQALVAVAGLSVCVYKERELTAWPGAKKGLRRTAILISEVNMLTMLDRFGCLGPADGQDGLSVWLGVRGPSMSLGLTHPLMVSGTAAREKSVFAGVLSTSQHSRRVWPS